MQKRIIRIIGGIRGRDSCREHFKKLKILPLKSQYVLSLLLFVINYRDYFMANSEIHNINTRAKSNLHRQIFKLSAYQKGITVFNSLPSQIKDLSHNSDQFKCALKNSFYFHSFSFWMNISVAIRTKNTYHFLTIFYVQKFYFNSCQATNLF
jgi:hypothetical protein